jgi:hypothetical protein
LAKDAPTAEAHQSYNRAVPWARAVESSKLTVANASHASARHKQWDLIFIMNLDSELLFFGNLSCVHLGNARFQGQMRKKSVSA